MSAPDSSHQPAAATPAPHSGGKGHVRPPHIGNRLWQLYCELGRPRAAAFRELLRASAIKFNTFTNDTRPSRRLGSIAAERMLVYREFFLAEEDLYEVIRAEYAAQLRHADH